MRCRPVVGKPLVARANDGLKSSTRIAPMTAKTNTGRCVSAASRQRIARRGESHGSGLGIFGYVAEQCISGLHGFKKACASAIERTAPYARSLPLPCLLPHLL